MRFGRPTRRLALAVLITLLAGCLGLLVAKSAVAEDEPVSWTLGKPPATVTAGQTFKLQITSKMQPGWHLYSVAQAPPPIATRISVPAGQPFSLDGAVEAPAPETAFDQNFGIDTEFYKDSAVFTLPIKVAADASGKQVLHVQAYFQTCNDRICMPPKTVKLETVVEVKGGAGKTAAQSVMVAAPPSASGGGDKATAPAAAASKQQTAASGAVPSAPTTAATTRTVAAPPPGASSPAASAVVSTSSGSSVAAGPAPRAPLKTPPLPASDSLLSFLLLAVISGALSLLTPCVFPMVPITVSYFTGHASGHRGRALRNASIYGIGIILTFTAFGVLLALFVGATSLNRFAANPWINLLITAIFVGFALNLFGVFEINVPSGLLTRLDQVARQEGGSEVIGSLLMGFTFTLTSFTCTVPFVGNVAVIASDGTMIRPILGMLAYSTVFALPFFVLALMPQYVSQMPRSGAWLHAVKVLMAFLEIAAAMKFISNVDLIWRWGIFTREVVLATWVVIAASMALYLLGVFRFPGEPRVRKVRAGRWLLASGCLALGVWLSLGVMGRRLGEIEAFLPPAEGVRALAAGDEGTGIKGELTWIMNDYDGALARARRENKLVMVDFTGYTCTNCRWMEANMFTRPDVRAELEKYVRVRMYTDGDGEIFQKQQALQQAMFKTVALPYYAILDAEGRPLAAFPGLTRDPVPFIDFLKKGASPQTN